MTEHQFIRISDKTKPIPGNTFRGLPGAVVVCAICGEVKHVFEDGDVVLIKPGDITHEDPGHGKPA